MSTIANLGDLIEPLKRELAVPGEFETYFPNTDDDGLFTSILDGFGEAQLDRWFPATTLDITTGDVSPELSLGQAALVVIYTSIRIIRSKMRQTTVNSRYKAGAVEYETSASASLLKAELDALIERKKDLLYMARAVGSSVYFLDGYLSRMYDTWYDGGPINPRHLY